MKVISLAFVFTMMILFLAVSASAQLGVGLGFSRSTTSVYSGRYAFIPKDATPNSGMLIDTETGRMWQLVEIHVDKGGNTYKLIPIPYEDLTGNKIGVHPEAQIPFNPNLQKLTQDSTRIK